MAKTVKNKPVVPGTAQRGFDPLFQLACQAKLAERIIQQAIVLQQQQQRKQQASQRKEIHAEVKKKETVEKLTREDELRVPNAPMTPIPASPSVKAAAIEAQKATTTATADAATKKDKQSDEEKQQQEQKKREEEEEEKKQAEEEEERRRNAPRPD